MVKKCRLNILLLLVAFILLPIFSYPFSTEKVSQSKNDYNFSIDFHIKVLDGYFQEVDDDNEFGYCQISSVFIATIFQIIPFCSLSSSSFHKENLSYQEFSIPPPFLT
jgi:hypothetical protein